MTRCLLRLVPLAAIASLTACAPIPMPTGPQQAREPLLAPSSAAPVLIGRIGRPGHYQVGPVTAHPSRDVCSPTWYKRGFVSSYIKTWNMDVGSAETSYDIAHGTSTPADQKEMHRLAAMAFAPPDFPPPPAGFFHEPCGQGSEALGGTDGQNAAEHAWYTEHKRLIAEHVLTY